VATDRLGQTIAEGDAYLVCGRVLRIDGDNVVLVTGDRNEHVLRVRAGDVAKVDAAVLAPGEPGSVLVSNGTAWVPLAPGSTGQFLRINGDGIPAWETFEP
jgi:hypothetical protein